MINGLAWSAGAWADEAEACMLGQPCSMLLPRWFGFKLFGKLPEAVPPRILC